MSQTESKKMFMDGKLYNAAVEGNIDALMEEQAQLDRLLTPRSNTILHIHILARPPNTESTLFLQRVLEMCPSLLFQANTKGEIPLHIAAKYGHDVAVKVLIESAKSQGHYQLSDQSAGYKQQMLWVTNNEKDTALHESVRMNHIDVVRMLIAEDPEYSYSGNAAGETPLYLAVERGYNDIAYEILERCQSQDHGGPHGRTTLHAAVIREDFEMTARILIKTWPSYALTRKVDEEGWTPLHYSTQNQYMGVFQLLLAVDKPAAYVASKDKQWTPLHTALRTGGANSLKELILQCPDSVELVDHQGWNILHHAIDKYDAQDLSSFLQIPVTSKLLNDKDTHGNTPVHQIASASCGHDRYSDAFFTLAAPLVDKNARNDIDQTPLDILLKDVDQSPNVTDEKKKFTTRMKESGFKQSIQNKIEGKKPVKSQNQHRSSDEKEALKRRIKKVRETSLAMATLTATITFAAIFNSLLPDDYYVGAEGRRLEIFSRRTALQAFIVCHTVAMAFSNVCTYTWMPPEQANNKLFASSFLMGYLQIIIFMGGTVLAFAAGAYALLSLSKLRSISIILINSLFHYFKGPVNNFS